MATYLPNNTHDEKSFLWILLLKSWLESLQLIIRGVCHTVAFAIYVKKYILRQKKKWWKFKYFTKYAKNIIFKTNPLKETQKILQDMITRYPNLKFQHKPKIIMFLKHTKSFLPWVGKRPINVCVYWNAQSPHE
jgi:hypothetical protein